MNKIKPILKYLISKIPSKNLQESIKNLLKALYAIFISPYIFILYLKLNKSFKERLNSLLKLSKIYGYDLKNECYIAPNINAPINKAATNTAMGGGIS